MTASTGRPVDPIPIVRTILCCLCLVALSITAYARNGVWRTYVSFWEDSVRKSPAKARARTNLGNSYLLAGRKEDAAREYKAALSLDPGFADAHYNLGKIYLERGQPDEALDEFLLAAKSDPNDPDAHYMIGNSYFTRGYYNDAVREYLISLGLKPDYEDARYNLELAKKAMKEARSE